MPQPGVCSLGPGGREGAGRGGGGGGGGGGIHCSCCPFNMLAANNGDAGTTLGTCTRLFGIVTAGNMAQHIHCKPSACAKHISMSGLVSTCIACMPAMHTLLGGVVCMVKSHKAVPRQPDSLVAALLKSCERTKSQKVKLANNQLATLSVCVVFAASLPQEVVLHVKYTSRCSI